MHEALADHSEIVKLVLNQIYVNYMWRVEKETDTAQNRWRWLYNVPSIKRASNLIPFTIPLMPNYLYS